MQGLMMEYPLTVSTILERARTLFPNQEISSRGGSGAHRYNYRQLYDRTCRLARALRRLGVQPGERLATLAWNTGAHLEIYLGAPCYGAVLHTLNLRLAPEQIGYISRHAEDTILFVDQSLLPLAEQFCTQVPTLRHIVVMNEEKPLSTSLPVLRYEALLAAEDPSFAWPVHDENSAAVMCYTSGTTGHPKGCVYTHRSLFLHSMTQAMAEVFGITENDVVMPIVPMFHANAWGIPYCATLVGARQVLPGANLQPHALLRLMEQEKVTIAAGVPTIWIGLLAALEERKYDLSSLRLCPIGGSAVPQSLIEAYRKRYGVNICQAWGMTEMSPLGTVSRLRSYMREWPEERQYATLALQGAPAPLVEMRGIDAEGHEIPWDGKTLGELQVRGPWVISSYYNDPRSEDSFLDGWFRTGDVVTINQEGYIHIADRTKDLIKSGGEWISSVDLESAIMAHPDVLEAAVIAVPDDRWQERPLACVVPKPQSAGQLTRESIATFLRNRVPQWWIPEEVAFIEQVPKTSVGKFDKKVLRARFQTTHRAWAGNPGR
jgi:fatty-acyl-CoA synthase